MEDDVTFELYTLKNKHKPQVLLPGNLLTIETSNFNGSLPTRIYIHGFLEFAGNMKSHFNDGKSYAYASKNGRKKASTPNSLKLNHFVLAFFSLFGKSKGRCEFNCGKLGEVITHS